MEKKEFQNNINDRAHSATRGRSRRNFLKGAATAATIAAAVPLQPLLGGKESQAEATVMPSQTEPHDQANLAYHTDAAKLQHIDIGVLRRNGEQVPFSDHSALWHRAVLHDDLEIATGNAWQSFVNALSSGGFEDFENVIVGNPGGTNFTDTLNGPMASYAFDLEGLDSRATSIPSASSVTSAQDAVEAVEHYWGALLRDVAFIGYPNNPLVAKTGDDMNELPFVRSGSVEEPAFPVMPQNLFGGQMAKDGHVQGPFISQFMIQPIFYGALPLSQQLQDFMLGQNFRTTVDESKRMQNEQVSAFKLKFDSKLHFIHAGRSADTHVDALHQAYFTAALILLGVEAPLNPGNPYKGSQSQHDLGTLSESDALGTVSEMATRALKGIWFHKWLVNLRSRPERYYSDFEPFEYVSGICTEIPTHSLKQQGISRKRFIPWATYPKIYSETINFGFSATNNHQLHLRSNMAFPAKGYSLSSSYRGVSKVCSSKKLVLLKPDNHISVAEEFLSELIEQVSQMNEDELNCFDDDSLLFHRTCVSTIAHQVQKRYARKDLRIPMHLKGALSPSDGGLCEQPSFGNSKQGDHKISSQTSRNDPGLRTQICPRLEPRHRNEACVSFSYKNEKESRKKTN